MELLPNTLLVIRCDDIAILVDSPLHNYASEIGGTLYPIAYYGYQLQVAIQPYERIVKYLSEITRSIGGKATVALLQ